MIDRDYARLMARYNAWQNGSLYREADKLSEAERQAARGAYFSSIHGTFSHLFWADSIWMHRFAGTPKPMGGIRESTAFMPDWEELKPARRALDTRIAEWADNLPEDWLPGRMTWFSGALGREVSKARWHLAAHFFNHQTHHRGQLHAMITAAGGRPDDTDLFLLESS